MLLFDRISSLRCLALLFCGLAPLSPAHAQDVLPAGISLPQRGSMYVVDHGPGGAALIQLHATEIVHNLQAAGNMARSLIYVGSRASVELEGINAAVHVKGSKVAFLARLSEDETDLMRSRLALVHLRQGDKRRVVSTYSQNVFGGQRKRQYDLIPLVKKDVADSDWVKLTPEKPLEPGEYGIIVMPKDPTLFPDAVYDFDVDVSVAKPD